MLDIGWTELLVVAVVLIVVVGPKDLPPMLRAFGKMTANLRKMAGDFRTQFDQALREADMDDVRQTISDAQRFHPANAIREAINPLRDMGNEIRNDLQKATAMPPLTATETKAEGEGASASSLEDLLPKPELSLPDSPPAAVSAAPVAAQASGSAPATPATAAPQPVAASGTQAAPEATPASGDQPLQKKPRAPRKPKGAAAEADVAASAPKPARHKTRALAKPEETAVVPAVTAKPATRARKKPATPKDNA
ncbi:Sec-independent protein translocase protein TatB [Affinirhizobium pseudoryzae]|uniref:Sec-independent protein translocase protein TatB n=1 Tax=Allorhizobium pseudoryzae TaxID=379684 RepID=UPI0013ED86EB|nr:Sec-independent protein translocase protein TatB [Allorhizobium pseudoryzae]